MMMYEKRIIQGTNIDGFDRRILKIIHDYWKEDIRVTIEVNPDENVAIVETDTRKIKPEVNITDKEIAILKGEDVPEDKPASYKDCEFAIKKDCYFKNNHMLKHSFCKDCVVDKDIWGDKAFVLRRKDNEAT